MTTLCSIPAGSNARVLKLEGEESLCHRLREMGFSENSVVRCVQSGAGMICQIQHSRVGLSRQLASRIHVEPLPQVMSECPLSQLGPGGSGRVRRIDGAGSAMLRLQEMGLIRGTAVKFIRAAPLGDPIEIRVRGYSLSLRKTEADAVIVERDE